MLLALRSRRCDKIVIYLSFSLFICHPTCLQYSSGKKTWPHPVGSVSGNYLIKARNYLTSHNKVNGLTTEDVWCPQLPYMTDAHIWFGSHREWVWQSLDNSDSPYTDGGSNQFALGCFTGPTGCQSSQTPDIGPMCYFMVVWHWGLWVRLWVLAETDSLSSNL